MAPTKADAPRPKANHPPYQEMITDAIVTLKERNGSSRQALKKFVKANNNINTASDAIFDSLFNKALKSGVDKGVYEQPKGPSGGTKLSKKLRPAAAPKPAAGSTAEKPAAPKKAATAKKDSAAPKKAAVPKKAAATKPAAAAKSAARKKPTAKKLPTSKAAPAIVDKPAVLSKTKSGRVSKSTAPASKKGAAKKTPKKEAPKAETAS